MSLLLLTNCRLYDHPEPIATDILIEQNRIKALGKIPPHPDYQIIPINGSIATPGFIDIHIQGAGGYDVLDNSDEALVTISRTLARYGVTGFLATTIIKPEIENEHLKRTAAMVGKDLGGARLLGIHLEGPFINPLKRGGIASSAVKPFDSRTFTEIMELTQGQLKLMTIAPEIDGGLTLAELLLKKGVVPALGHTNATYEQTRQAIALGVSHVTHIFNAMPPFHHREPGPIAAILEASQVTAQIISDGVHLHPAIVNFLTRVLTPERCICISDGIQAIGLPDGIYHYNNQEYCSQDGTARYHDGTLIGTALAVNQIAQRFRQFSRCSLAEAVTTITLNPARVLGLDNYGKILPGHIADLAVMDEDFNVWMTIRDGKIIYQSPSLIG